MWKPCFVFLFLSGFSQKMHQISSQNGSQKKHHKMMPLGTQNHPKMHQNSMFFPPKTPNCANKVIFGRFVFLAIFWIAFFPVFGRIWCQNGVLGKNHFQTFPPILEVKTLFVRPPPFLSIFLAKISKKCKNPNRINWKYHRVRSKFEWKFYAQNGRAVARLCRYNFLIQILPIII